MDGKMKKISSKDVFKGIRVHVVQEEILLPNGKIANWELIVHPGAAAVIPIDSDGKVIMVRQYRNSLDNYSLEIPAGVVDYIGEDPKSCASRELEEEIGYRSENIEFLFSFYSAIGLCDEQIYVYVAKDLIPGKQNLDEEEFINIERYSVEELTDMILKGEIKDNKTISSVLLYKEKYL